MSDERMLDGDFSNVPIPPMTEAELAEYKKMSGPERVRVYEARKNKAIAEYKKKLRDEK